MFAQIEVVVKCERKNEYQIRLEKGLVSMMRRRTRLTDLLFQSRTSSIVGEEKK